MAVANLENEQWERIPAYEDFYEVSTEGRVKSRFRYARSGSGMRRVPEKLMTQTIHPQTGHMRVQLSKRGKIKTFVVYRLVLEIHGEKPRPDGHDVNHLDSNRENNALPNLEWIPSIKPNAGTKHKLATLNEEDVNEVRMLRNSGMPVEQVATKMQISKSQVSKIANGKSR